MKEQETKLMPTPSASDWGSASHLKALVLIAATGAGLYLCYRLALPFLPALAWALALAVFQLGVALLQAVDELRHVRLVGLPEKRHGGHQSKERINPAFYRPARRLRARAAATIIPYAGNRT